MQVVLSDLCVKWRHPRLMSCIPILVFSGFSSGVQRDYGQMSPTFPTERGNVAMLIAHTE